MGQFFLMSELLLSVQLQWYPKSVFCFLLPLKKNTFVLGVLFEDSKNVDLLVLVLEQYPECQIVWGTEPDLWPPDWPGSSEY